MAKKDVSMADKYVSMPAKGQTFNSFVSGTPMITLDKLTGSENYLSWVDSMDLWFIGKLSQKINVLSGDKLMFYYAIFSSNLLMPRLYIILGPIKLAILYGIR